MTDWKWNELDRPNTKAVEDSLSVFEKVFLEDNLKKQAVKEPQNQPENNSKRGILKHIFGAFN